MAPPDLNSTDLKKAVQVQQLRANLKAILESNRGWLVGDDYHVRAIVIPVKDLCSWRGSVNDAQLTAIRKRFKEALEALQK